MTLPNNLQNLDWQKGGGLIPVIVQDAQCTTVLMLGYMNEEALAASLKTGLVTFFSRSRNKLWQKGETSGNTLKLVSIETDCDHDALLVVAEPVGPTCHLGTTSCFAGGLPPGPAWLGELSRIIDERSTADPASSYTAQLLNGPVTRAAQKVGEEGVEVALAAVSDDPNALSEEAADLIYHLMVLLRARDLSVADVMAVLQQRHRGTG